MNVGIALGKLNMIHVEIVYNLVKMNKKIKSIIINNIQGVSDE